MDSTVIYAVADIHGRRHAIDRIRSVIRENAPDVMVVAGDISGFSGASEILSKLSEFQLPVLIVRGNSDSFRIEREIGRYPNLSSLHLTKMTINGTDFFGVGGAISIPFHSRICVRESRMLSLAETHVGKDTVLIAHPPPYGILDEAAGRFHTGSRNLRKFVLKREPAVLICGHIHERSGTAELGRTLVVNCAMGKKGAGVLLNVQKGKKPSAEIFS